MVEETRNARYKRTQHAKEDSNNLERIEFVVPVGNKTVLKQLETELKKGGTLQMIGVYISRDVETCWLIRG